MSKMYLYGKLPYYLQHAMCTFYGWRENLIRNGRDFYNYYSLLKETDRWSKDEIKWYKQKKIDEVLKYAYKNTSYYRNKLSDIILSDNKSNISNILYELPVLTKEDVIQNVNNIISNRYKKHQLYKTTTSGTTGTSLSFFTTKEALAFQWAVWWRHRYRFGITPRDWHINFTSQPIVPIDQKVPPFWRWDYARKQLLISMQSIKKENIDAIANVIDNPKFKFYSGAPSRIYSFAYLLKEKGIQLQNKPEYIFPGAENILDYQNELFHKIFNATVSDQYGFSEGCGNASKCEAGYYHEDWEFGILECEEKNTNSDGTYTGNILATGFANYAFPFIRYRVGDVGTWMPDDFQCPCGRKSKVLKHIDGRIEDYIVTPEGNRIMRLSHLFKKTPGIKEAQIYQKERSSITIRVVPRKSYSKEDEESIRNKVSSWVSPSLNVYFEKVDSIPRSSNGKLRAVISELNEN